MAHANGKQVLVPRPGALHAVIMGRVAPTSEGNEKTLGDFIFEDILCWWVG